MIKNKCEDSEATFKEALKTFDAIINKTERDKIIIMLTAINYCPFDIAKKLAKIDFSLRLAQELQATNPNDYSWYILLASIHLEKSLLYAIFKDQAKLDISNKKMAECLDIYNKKTNNETSAKLISLANEALISRNISTLRELSKLLDIGENQYTYASYDDEKNFKPKVDSIFPQQIYDCIYALDDTEDLEINQKATFKLGQKYPI